MFKGNGVPEVLDEVGCDLHPGYINHDWVGGITRRRSSGVVYGGHPEAVHDAVQDVAESATRLVPFQEGELDPAARLNVQHFHSVASREKISFLTHTVQAHAHVVQDGWELAKSDTVWANGPWPY